MRLSDLVPSEVRRYFEQRLGTQFRSDSVKQVTRCPFHQDRKPSLSLDFAKGVWHCFVGCGSGGLIDFEVKFSGGISRTQALGAIYETLGVEHDIQAVPDEEPEAIYPYTDEHGRMLFQKLRFPGKRFVQRMVGQDGHWVYKLGTVRKPLYNLPALITANNAIICEGEKDADNVNKLRLSSLDESGFSRVVSTTNFDGAGHWSPELSRCFSGKDVAILPDFDDPGRHHAAAVAASVFDFAAAVKVIELPGLEAHGDASDYLQTHSGQDLINEIQRAPLWVPTKSSLLVSAQEFMQHVSEEIDWLVNGVIQRGANGFVASDPKCGKSWLAVDLALALTTATPWMGMEVACKVRTALITREDAPALTKWRMRRLIQGRNLGEDDLEDRLYVNSRDQSPVFKLDVPEQLTEMMAALKQFRPEVIILDVLNVLHSGEENDNTEMRKILDHAQLMSEETRSGVCVLHHFNKDQKNGRLTQRIRGASAIAGWAEYVIGIHRQSDESEDSLRWMEFELKAASSPEKIYFRIQSDELAPRTTIQCEEPPVRPQRKRREGTAIP